MKTWRTDAAPVNRDAGEGPPRCCGTAIVAGDELWWLGGLPAPMLATMRTVFPAWASIADADLYACGHCKELLFRHLKVSREDWMRGHGFGPKAIAAAWVHDEQFWRRGPSSAPPEVQAQVWWPVYQDLFTQAQDAKDALESGGEITVSTTGRTVATVGGVEQVPTLSHPGQFRSAVDELLRGWDGVDV
jgi:hypothetical protein